MIEGMNFRNPKVSQDFEKSGHRRIQRKSTFTHVTESPIEVKKSSKQKDFENFQNLLEFTINH